MPRTVRFICLITLCLIGTTACEQLVPTRTPTPRTEFKGNEPYPIGQGTSVVPSNPEAGTLPTLNPPASGVIATALPGQPTALPGQATAPGQAVTPAQPGAVTGQATTLLGPEWTMLYTGDLNGDGAADAVAYKPANLNLAAAFQQPVYANYRGPVDSFVIVQSNPAGQPYVQVEGSRILLRSSGATLTAFAGASAHMLLVSAGMQPAISLQQVAANGTPLGKPLGLTWDAATGRYAIFTGTSLSK